MLNVMIDSLRRISGESLIDQAFLQLIFLRDRGYDVVRCDQQCGARPGMQGPTATTVRHLMDLVIRQKEKIQALEDENSFLKGLS